jgi:hypothetical protein
VARRRCELSPLGVGLDWRAAPLVPGDNSAGYANDATNEQNAIVMKRSGSMAPSEVEDAREIRLNFAGAGQRRRCE